MNIWNTPEGTNYIVCEGIDHYEDSQYHPKTLYLSSEMTDPPNYLSPAENPHPFKTQEEASFYAKQLLPDALFPVRVVKVEMKTVEFHPVKDVE